MAAPLLGRLGRADPSAELERSNALGADTVGLDGAEHLLLLLMGAMIAGYAKTALTELARTSLDLLGIVVWRRLEGSELRGAWLPSVLTNTVTTDELNLRL